MFVIRVRDRVMTRATARARRRRKVLPVGATHIYRQCFHGHLQVRPGS